MLKKLLVSAATAALMVGGVSPALAREGYSRNKPHVVEAKTRVMSVHRGDKRIKVFRATRRDIKNATRARWNPPKEHGASSSSASSTSSSDASSASSDN